MQSPRKLFSSSGSASASTGGSSSRPGTPTHFSRPASRSIVRPGSSLSMRSASRASSAHGNSNNVFTGSIQVAVRVKPDDSFVFSGSNGSSMLQVDSNMCTISAKDIGTFVFDNVLDTTASNIDLYETVRPLVNKVLSGFNGTVFAYGMTGSGKTYSMQGSADQRDPGIIPRVVEHIFKQSHNLASVSVSYLEIYNEHLHDLLDPNSNHSNDELKLREDRKFGIKVHGLKEVTVQSADELLDCILRGDALRRTEGTEFNARSSRSHAIVQIALNLRSGGCSMLNLCDLAGSERAVAQNDRRIEGSYINKSLLTLGTVISRLSSLNGSNSSTGNMTGNSAAHIPYRDSKLTRLLQPALSGKSLVTVICTVHPSNGVETISTLRFAARAKNITISVKKNDDSSSTATLLQQKIEQQNLEIARLRHQLANTIPLPPDTSYIAQLEAENKILHQRIEHLTRLCDDDQLEELMGVESNTGSGGPGDDASVTVSRSKINEYQSYIDHLEKRVMKLEAEASVSLSTAAAAGSGGSTPTIPNANSSFAMPPPSVPSSKAHYHDIISELQEEIRELKESNRDKDKIIEAFRSVSKHSHSQNMSSTINSQAYARYYHQSTPAVLGEYDLNQSQASPQEDVKQKEKDMDLDLNVNVNNVDNSEV